MRRTRGANVQVTGMLKPRIDLFDCPDAPYIICHVELPGMKKEDLSLQVQHDCLTISGERSPITPMIDDPSTKFAVREVKYGKFSRQVKLPPDIGIAEISASLVAGILTITWPRNPAGAEGPKRIEVAEA